MAAQKKGISRFAEETGHAHTVCGRRFRPPAGGMPVNGTFSPPSAPYPAHRHKQKPAFLWGIGRKGPAGRVQCFRRGVPAAAVPRLCFRRGIPTAFLPKSLALINLLQRPTESVRLKAANPRRAYLRGFVRGLFGYSFRSSFHYCRKKTAFRVKRKTPCQLLFAHNWRERCTIRR